MSCNLVDTSDKAIFQVHFSGKKWQKKIYYWHTGYPGGLKQRTATEMLNRNPVQILRKAILGMLTRNKLRHGFMEPRLKIYTGPTHPHTAQLPVNVEPLPVHTRSNCKDQHFGLKTYADPQSYLASLPPEISSKESIATVELTDEDESNRISS